MREWQLYFRVFFYSSNRQEIFPKGASLREDNQEKVFLFGITQFWGQGPPCPNWKKLPKLRAWGEGMIWAIPKERAFFSLTLSCSHIWVWPGYVRSWVFSLSSNIYLACAEGQIGPFLLTASPFTYFRSQYLPVGSQQAKKNEEKTLFIDVICSILLRLNNAELDCPCHWEPANAKAWFELLTARRRRVGW